MTHNRRTWLVFTVLTLLSVAACILFIDRPVATWLRQFDNEHGLFFRVVAQFETFGRGEVYFGLLILLALWAFTTAHLPRFAPFRARQNALLHQTLFVLASFGACNVALTILKKLIGRARPIVDAREGFYGFHPVSMAHDWNSLPSGHTCTAFSFALLAGAVWPKTRLPLLVLACCVAASRVLMGAHYPGDVVAAIALAYAMRAACLAFYEKRVLKAPAPWRLAAAPKPSAPPAI